MSLPPRLDVFSLKGGVGKTTVAWLLSSRRSRQQSKPVLLVDLDLGGSCLGDLLLPRIHPGWDETYNLAHLVCDHPESLPERLGPDAMPVYTLEQAAAAKRVSRSDAGSHHVLIAPSHLYSVRPTNLTTTCPNVDPMVLHALVGHESAGQWIEHVLQQLISATANLLGGPDQLAAVVVDHGPGIAAVQRNALELDASRKLLVTSPDFVDLRMINTLMGSELDPTTQKRCTIVVNRSHPEPSPPNGMTLGQWYTDAHKLPDDSSLAQAYRGAQLSTATHPTLDERIETLCGELFA